MGHGHPHDLAADSARNRLRAGMLSFVVAVVLLAVKFYAWQLTGSSAVLSDAMESIVNVVAAVFMLGSLLFAQMPADRNHPYGHGKIEFFTAAFEGGLIVFAGVLVLWEAWLGFQRHELPHELSTGLLLVAGAGVANLLLGLFLVRSGRTHDSLALVADGKHLIADFWTSAGVVGGLLVAMATGIWWLDPLIAALVALHLLVAGFALVRHAAGGLLDEEDPELLARLVEQLQDEIGRGVISVHNLRAIRAGRFHHVSAHLVVPEFWTVERAHDLAEAVAERVIERVGVAGELEFHTDPCRRAHCGECDLRDCPIRQAEFQARPKLTVDQAVDPDRAVQEAETASTGG